MGRPPKRNLNYSTWDVDVLENDTSIDNLIDAQGPAGFYVYFALCQKAYATDGYFYRWGYDNAASTARKLGGGLKSTQVRAIVDLCVSLGLFDKALFTTDGILTSRAIQSRYLDGIARRTGEIPIIVEYWLLEVTPRAGLVFVHKNGETAYKALGFQGQGPVPQVMVRHDRVAAVLFYPKNCHFTDASFRCKQKKQRPFAPGDGRSERCAYLIIFRLCGI